jgi:hypothetical protein
MVAVHASGRVAGEAYRPPGARPARAELRSVAALALGLRRRRTVGVW